MWQSSIPRLIPKTMLAVAVIHLSCSSLNGASSDDLLKQLVANHKSKRESMRSFSAHRSVRVKQAGGPEATLQFKYWRNGDDIRQQTIYPSGVISEEFVVNSEGKSVTRSLVPGTNRYETSGATKFARAQFRGDVWNALGMTFTQPRPPGASIPLEELLTYAKSSPKVKVETIDGHKCLRLELSYEGQDTLAGAAYPVELTVWFSTRHNYLVHKRKMIYGAKSEHVSEFAITEYFEYEPGEFFPSKAESSRNQDGVVRASYVDEVGEIRVNKPVEKDRFQAPQLPKGASVVDLIENTAYPVDENWKQSGPSKPHLVYATPAHSESGGEVHTSQTPAESRKFNWILLVSIAVVTLGIALGIFRRLKSRHEES